MASPCTHAARSPWVQGERRQGSLSAQPAAGRARTAACAIVHAAAATARRQHRLWVVAAAAAAAVAVSARQQRLSCQQRRGAPAAATTRRRRSCRTDGLLRSCAAPAQATSARPATSPPMPAAAVGMLAIEPGSSASPRTNDTSAAVPLPTATAAARPTNCIERMEAAVDVTNRRPDSKPSALIRHCGKGRCAAGGGCSSGCGAADRSLAVKVAARARAACMEQARARASAC